MAQEAVIDKKFEIIKLQNKSIHDCEISGCEYWTNGQQVFYGRHKIPIENASKDTFYCVGNSFAFDNKHVYRQRELIKGVSSKGFTVLNYAFIKTESHVISRSGKVKITLDSNIEIYDEGKWYNNIDYPKGYIRIDNVVYYEGHCSGNLEQLKNVNVEKFSSLKNGVYGKDDERVYAFGKIINGVKAEGFRMLVDSPLCGYGVYESKLYFQNEKVHNADMSSIRITETVLESDSHIFLLEGNGKYYVSELEVSEDTFMKWINTLKNN